MGIFGRRSKLESYTEPEYADLMTEARERFKAAAEADEMQRLLELDDLRFCDPDGQWPADIRGQRDADGRPCLTVDRLTPFVHQIVNEQRQNRPQPSVNPVGDGADKQTAEILQGMIRHIAYMSNGDTAVDTAFESQVRCGRGYFRVLTEYLDDKSFDQEVVIKRIPNLHMVYLDPSATEPDGSDAEYGFITSYIPHSVYRHEYPKSKLASLNVAEWKSIGDEAPDWAQKDGSAVMVVEYFRKVRKPVTVYRLSDGSSVTEKPDEFEDSRVSMQVEIQWFKLNAIEKLEETVWPGKYIPIVPVYGTELNVDGIRTWSGLIRSAKDAQRAFNYWKSAQAETIALAPKAPWVAPLGSIPSNLRNIWQNANKRPVSLLEYKAFDDQQRPLNPPSRTMVEPPIQAITMAMQGAIDDLKGTTGMYDANLGMREGGQSGVAIRQLQRQGQAGSFHYADNLARSIRHLGRVLIDLIPKIYDTQRTVRIIKPDESSDTVTINGPTDEQDEKTGLQKVYDLTVGTYDVTVSVGPSYQTKRQENQAMLESAMQGPMGQLITQVAPDIWASMLDFQVAPQLVERFKLTLPPQLQDKPKGQGQQIPPQVQQMMQAAQQKDQQSGQMIEQLTQTVHKLQDEIDGQTAKAQQEMAKAQLDAQTKLQIAQMDNEAKILIAEAQIQGAGAIPALNAELAELKQQQEELAELALHLYSGSGAMPPEAQEPQPDVEPVAPKADPMHKLMEGHSAALQSIAEALKRSSGPRKRTIQTDPSGNPVGLLDEPGEE